MAAMKILNIPYIFVQTIYNQSILPYENDFTKAICCHGFGGMQYQL